MDRSSFAGMYFQLAGWLLVGLGVVGLFATLEAMSDDGFGSGYATADRWLAALAAAVVVGLGLVVAVTGRLLDEYMIAKSKEGRSLVGGGTDQGAANVGDEQVRRRTTQL